MCSHSMEKTSFFILFGENLIFRKRLGVTLRVFLSYFVFPFKNKIKISGDSKFFSKNQIFTKQNKKNEFSPSSGNASIKMRGPHLGKKA